MGGKVNNKKYCWDDSYFQYNWTKGIEMKQTLFHNLIKMHELHEKKIHTEIMKY